METRVSAGSGFDHVSMLGIYQTLELPMFDIYLVYRSCQIHEFFIMAFIVTFDLVNANK